MRKLRVAFFIDEWTPGTGTEHQLQGLLSHLAPTYIDAHFFTLRRPLAPEHRHLFPCPVDCLSVGKLRSLEAILRLPVIATRLRLARFDLAMIYFVDSNLYLVPACHLAGISRIVINRRDMGYWYEPGLLRKVNCVNRWSSDFLVNCTAVKEHVVRFEHVPPDRITVIPNGIWDPQHRQGTAARTLGHLPPGLPANGLLVGITASLREVKRIDRFLEMAAIVVRKVPTARFVIAGQGQLRTDLEARALELGISDVVTFLGQVADVGALLPLLRVGVLTSSSEGLSNSLLEYGLAGVPAVAFRVGGNPEILREGLTGFLVPADDTRRMADRVVELLTDDELHAAMGRAARRHCETAFAPDRIRELTLEFFASIVARQRPFPARKR